VRISIFLAVAAVLCLVESSRADKPGPPRSHKVVSTDGKFVFVVLSPWPAEKELQGFDEKSELKKLRDTYQQSGLYKNDGSKEPLWAVDWYRRPVAIVSDGSVDGVRVIRYGGPHVYEQRLNKDLAARVLTENDLKKEALSVIADGKVLREFSIGEFVDDPKSLSKGATFFMWMKQSKLIENKKQLEIVTHDGNRVLIDLAAAKILEKAKAK
jgi:hypothetical protein